MWLKSRRGSGPFPQRGGQKCAKCNGVPGEKLKSTEAHEYLSRVPEAVFLLLVGNASQPTLFPSELLDDTKEPSFDRVEFSSIMCRQIKARAFPVSTVMLGLNEPSAVFKRKKIAVRPCLPGDIPL